MLRRPPPPPPPTVQAQVPVLLLTATLLLGACCCLWNALSQRSLRGWRRPYVLALTINVLAVAIDGRFDSEGDLTKLPWPTLFSPAGWAFAIWGVIYMGELAGLAVVLLSSDGSLERAVRASNAAWLAANCAQALWCAAFRPWALELLWLSTLLLATAAVCLLQAQRRLLAAADEAPLPPATLAALGPARSLHLGWLLAACLVNLNAWVGRLALGPAGALAAAVCSLVAAGLAGAALMRARLPAACFALSWALLAASKGTPVGADAASLGAPTLAGLARAEAVVAAALAAAVGAWAVRATVTIAAAKAVPVGAAALGSTNPGKLAALRSALRAWGMGHEVVSVGGVASGVSEQPIGLEETLRGARNRAEGALRAGPPGTTLGVGLESGLLAVEAGGAPTIDVCACVVTDGASHGVGWSSGWVLPPCVARSHQQGLELNAAIAKAGIAPDDRGGGALGQLSAGRLSRPKQMAQAVELALLHLQNRELYAK